MHEVGLLRTTLAELAHWGTGRPIRQVALAVGPEVDLDAAQSAWREAATGTTAAAATVTWERAADGLVCFSCGASYEGDRLAQCPDCGGSGLVVREAPEITIVDWTCD